MSGVLVHEWLSRVGGSERVFDAMAAVFPDADLLTLWNDDPEGRYPGRPVKESWMARTPLRRHKVLALPLMPLTWRRRVGDYEWALVSSHVFAHHVTFRGAPTSFRKYVYVHTPARYIWTPALDPRGQAIGPRLVAPALKRLDKHRAREAYDIAANSAFVRSRIRRAWGRDARVIYPPVDVEVIQSREDWSAALGGADGDLLSNLPRPFLLGASRFIPYKRLDLVIRAGEAAGLPVVLAGAGPEGDRLRAQAADARIPVTFVDHPDDAVLYALYQAADVFVFPAVEDFGIMPVEAMAAGTPVVSAGVGGGAETVQEGVTGAHLSPQPSALELKNAVHRAMGVGRAACRERATAFGRARFEAELAEWIAAPGLGDRQ